MDENLKIMTNDSSNGDMDRDFNCYDERFFDLLEGR